MVEKEILELTKRLVEIPSVNATGGERDIGVYIENYLRKLPYFKAHPEYVIVQELKEDSLHRRNVFALLMGEKERKPDTLLFHGHIDTVGVDDFGALAQYAFLPDQLMEELKKTELPREVREDLLSGDYLFGRGACDMKSGDAVFLVLMKYLSMRPGELAGNILLSFNPVEENLHTGIIEGCEVLAELRDTYHLTYRLAVNNDYICPMYPGDTHRYIYTGVGGKLLPCFYIRGRETHVGQCYEGFCASTVAANLLHELNLNSRYSDGYQGEYSLPPTVLKMKDLKTWYNVQTAQEAFIYFNWFVHNASIPEIVAKLRAAGETAFARTEEEIQEKYRGFCEISGKEYQKPEYESEVLTYAKLYQRAAERMTKRNGDAAGQMDAAGVIRHPELDKRLADMTAELQEKGVDKREIPLELIRELLGIAEIVKPVMVLYFAAPYCPHNTLKEADGDILEKLAKIMGELGKEEHIDYEICHFFPSLSDSSYLRIDDSRESIGVLKDNFPQMEQLYPLPFEKIMDLDIPAVNFGVYGKDAHKWTERVNIPYSFGVLPKLLEKTIREFLNEA